MRKYHDVGEVTDHYPSGSSVLVPGNICCGCWRHPSLPLCFDMYQADEKVRILLDTRASPFVSVRDEV